MPDNIFEEKTGQGSPYRILIAAPKSGSGKTTVTCGLLCAFKDRGLDVCGFKCGPDYIDPLFHKKVLGIESRNLDTYFAGREGVKQILYSCRKEYAVIEGVMGLYDGLDAGAVDGSAYEIAEATDTPVVLVVDASGVGRTVISQIKGMLLDDRSHLIRGVILNRISEGFYEKLHPVLVRELSDMREDVRVLGFFPNEKEIGISSRHLGLMLPGEIDDLKEKISRAAALLESHVDVDALTGIMREAGESGAETATKIVTEFDTWSDTEHAGEYAKEQASEKEPAVDKELEVSDERGLTLAVALDEAFCFYYKENLEAFEKPGVRICFFSPLHDTCLPKDADGILLGGGYPENHLEALSKNTSMLSSIRNAIGKGIPSLAECGGFMYLHKTIEDTDGGVYEMVGAIDGSCTYAGHLVRFGYLEITGTVESSSESGVSIPGASEPGTSKPCIPEDKKERAPLYESMVGLRGHEFHYYESSDKSGVLTAAKPDGSKSRSCIVSKNNGLWGFPHFYYPSAPAFVRCFVEKMKQVREDTVNFI